MGIKMDKRAFNRCLNKMKDRFPNELTLIEGIQNILNKKVEVISETNRRALRMFPMQFIQRIQTGHGEWTTQLHIWADNLVDTLLEVDPLVLTARNSSDETVLHSLIFAATGKFTEQVDYMFIQHLLDKNMGFIKFRMPGNEASKVEGNAWAETDSNGKTPMDYLIEFANGNELEDIPVDENLTQMLEEFAQSPVTDEPVDNTPEPLTPEEDEMQKQAFAANEQEIDDTLAPTPDQMDTVGDDTGNAGDHAEPDMTTIIQDKQLDKAQTKKDNGVDDEQDENTETAESHPSPENREQELVTKQVSNAMLEALLNY